MHYRFLFVFTLALWSAVGLSLPKLASADVPLNRAVVLTLRNQVRLLLKDQPPRPAKRMDIMVPGDALATARTALAELTFNDQTFARVGEQALFRFQPNTRDFRLDNGTLLLLVPPGQGRTRVRTPNAAAGIRGSALFVRYNPDTNTTLVGALTNSQIEVTNQDGSQNQPLKAGQMAVIVQGRIERVYDFDLNTFYETSELTRGLDLPRRQATANPNPAIAAVQAETAEAIRAQIPVVGQGSIDNPAFVRLSQAGNSAPPALVSDVNRAIPDSLSPVTGVTTNSRPAVSGRPPSGETVVRVVNPGVSGPKPELPPASPGSSPAPLPPETIATPAPPRVPALPPQVPSERPPTSAPAPLPPPSEVVVPAPAPMPSPPAVIVQPAPAPLPPAEIIVQPAPAPAPLPSPPAVIVQPAPAPAPLPPAEIIVQPAPAPAPLPSPPAVIVQPAPAPLPPAEIIVQPAPAPAPLPSPPAVIVQPAPAPAPLPPTPEVVAQPAPAPLPPAPQAIPASIQPLETAPAPSVNPAPVTFPSPDKPPIVPTSNPGVQAPAAKVAPPLR